MARYIDADVALDMLKAMLYSTAMNNLYSDIQYAEALEDVCSNRIETWINDVPTADVREVVRGEWILNDKIGTFKINTCSICGFNSEAEWNYCPNCGAEIVKEVTE